jgi:hypothetical protein
VRMVDGHGRSTYRLIDRYIHYIYA